MERPSIESARPSDAPLDFIRAIVVNDSRSGKHGGRVATRFPPEPNGYLHIGHAKSICLNFGVAAEFGGTCNLRFDDTNPTKEDVEYVDSIKADVKWLGFDWGDRLFYASDYFEQLYGYAVHLIEHGNAYVDSLTAVSAPSFHFSSNTTYPTVRADFEKSFATVAALPCDILLTPHPGVSDVFGRLDKRDQGDANAFADPGMCKQLAQSSKVDFDKRLAEETAGKTSGAKAGH